jgi:acyl-CoA thioesterase FadM
MGTRLRRPVLLGMRLRVEGRVSEMRSRLILTAARVLDHHGEELATATGKFVPMDPEAAGAWLADLICDGASLRPDEIFAV